MLRRVLAAVLGTLFLPAFLSMAQEDHGHGHPPKPPPGSGKDKIDARAQLVRPDPAVDEDANGDVRLKEHKGRSGIQVFVRHLDQGATYDVNISKGDTTELLGKITIVAEDDNDDNDNGDHPKAPRCFKAALSGDQEVPAVTTEATGTGKFQLTGRDRATLRYQVVVQGLSGEATAAHIHTGAVGVGGPVLIPLDPATLRGVIEVTAEQIAALESGDTYVNVHTAANPSGEIRGQIAACTHDGDDDDEGMNDDQSGNGKLRLDTKRGDKLPLSATSVADLVGSLVKVSNAGGAVVLQGTIEDLEKHHFGRGEGHPPGDGAGAALLPVEPVLEEFLFDIHGRHDATFRRGDSNMDGTVNIADPVSALAVLFRGAPMPYCPDAADANDDGQLDISDPVSMLRSLFMGTGLLPAPSLAAGFDATGDQLFCREE